MIGQRVWVGGSKPGAISFIGETQFAPGDWAGVTLDEPTGESLDTVLNFSVISKVLFAILENITFLS